MCCAFQRRLLINLAAAFGCVTLTSGSPTSPRILRFTNNGMFVTGRTHGEPIVVGLTSNGSHGMRDCEVLNGKEAVDDVLKRVPAKSILKVPDEDILVYLVSCKNVLRVQPTGRTLSDDLRELTIFPGTKWCGSGNIATGYNDLGEAQSTDRCCREHDHSKDNIAGFGKKHGITNKYPYTMTNCDDDSKFYKCLLNDPSDTSGRVGAMYFDVLQTPCFAKAHPVNCTQEKDSSTPEDKLFGEKTCTKYTVEKSAPETWQEFPPPNFSRDYIQRWGPSATPFMTLTKREETVVNWKVIKNV
ncbi:phospholipase A2 hemilipin-like [Ornithodoros turicata]|uniref:phospholipase A2 hemilipin-like n=1 Tax=Ornithodoros turicata TaxID=34597 RepID=UPI003138C533